jgi:hypothetical protein
MIKFLINFIRVHHETLFVTLFVSTTFTVFGYWEYLSIIGELGYSNFMEFFRFLTDTDQSCSYFHKRYSFKPYEDSEAFLEKKDYYDRQKIRFAEKAAKRMREEGCSSEEIEQKKAQIINATGPFPPSNRTLCIIVLVIVLIAIIDVR